MEPRTPTLDWKPERHFGQLCWEPRLRRVHFQRSGELKRSERRIRVADCLPGSANPELANSFEWLNFHLSWIDYELHSKSHAWVGVLGVLHLQPRSGLC